MGWSFSFGDSKADVIRELSRDEAYRNEQGEVVRDTLARCLRGNVLWLVRRTRVDGAERGRVILCVLLARRKNEGWGYKDMSESMHPYHYSCPLPYLDLVPDGTPGTCSRWRAKVREFNLPVDIGRTYQLRHCTIPEMTVTEVRRTRVIGTYKGSSFRVSRATLIRE